MKAGMNEMDALHGEVANELKALLNDKSLTLDERLKAIEAARKFLKDNNIVATFEGESTTSDILKTLEEADIEEYSKIHILK